MCLDLGFLYNNNSRGGSAYVGYNVYEPYWKFIKSWSELEVEYERLYNPNEFTTLGVMGKFVEAVLDPHFFDPESHMKHMHHMKLDEIMYIEHMIPHHQVAVDMSKVLLKNTNNDFMIHLAYRIIRNQQHEILMLIDLLNNLKNDKVYKYKSDLLI